jgi:AcrR family transcriptional regulator
VSSGVAKESELSVPAPEPDSRNGSLARVASEPRTTTGRTARAGAGGLKGELILAVAAERFAQQGYEDTKWADIAAAVDIGTTALYHYFESKEHCLFTIMEDVLADHCVRFERIVSRGGDFPHTLVDVLDDLFEVSDADVQRNRLLVVEQSLLHTPHPSPRGEAARRAAQARSRDLEFAWGTFLSRGMQQGAIADHPPRLLARAVLGLTNSVWHWYRPGGSQTLEQVAGIYVRRTLAMLELPPEFARRSSVRRSPV